MKRIGKILTIGLLVGCFASQASALTAPNPTNFQSQWNALQGAVKQSPTQYLNTLKGTATIPKDGKYTLVQGFQARTGSYTFAKGKVTGTETISTQGHTYTITFKGSISKANVKGHYVVSLGSAKQFEGDVSGQVVVNNTSHILYVSPLQSVMASIQAKLMNHASTLNSKPLQNFAPIQPFQLNTGSLIPK